MKPSLLRISLLALLASSPASLACEPLAFLDGSTLSIENCVPGKDGCRSAAEVLYEYAEIDDDDPALMTVALQTSPWRMYGPDLRIVRADELAAMIKPELTPAMKKVELQGNWTGVAPKSGGKSLAKQLSSALGGIPVSGMDGFMWVKRDGSVRTTRQSFSIRKGHGYYGVKPGQDVMSALAVGWFSEVEAEFAAERNAEAVLRAAVGWDVFYLCPDHALQSFESAAKLGNGIGAYNAAVIRLDRGQAGDRDAAIALLRQGVALKDKQSAALLASLH
jgi:hypothetical protein